MSTTQQWVDLFAERLLTAEDKQKAADRILHQMGKMKRKANSQPISFEEKTKMVELVARKVTSEAKSKGVDRAPYVAMINYMLANLDGKEG
jgi:hypothetical protein